MFRKDLESQLAIGLVIDDVKRVKTAIKRGLVISVNREMNGTPTAHGVILRGQLKMLRVLVKHGLPINDEWMGLTPLELSYALMDSEAFEILKKAGASPGKTQESLRHELISAVNALEAQTGMILKSRDYDDPWAPIPGSPPPNA